MLDEWAAEGRAGGRARFAASLPALPGVRALLVALSVVLAAASALLFVPPIPAAAQGRTLEIESFHADLDVLPSGEMQVTETLQVRFDGSWNGIYRTIPVEYRTDYGANYTLRIDMEAITDSEGNDLRYETDRSGRDRVFQIWVPGAEDATRIVVLRYAVANGLRFFEEHDELYWNVTGTETQFPISSASATVSLPEAADGIRTSAFTGAAGSTQSNARISEASGRLRFETTQPLRFREGLTIVVGWNPGAVERPSRLDRAWGFLLGNFPLGLPPLVALGMFFLWSRHGRDPEMRSEMVEYEPPEGLTPAEAGTLIDTSPDMRDITASLVDLAVRGFLSIEEKQEKSFLGLISKETFIFHLEAPRERWSELKEHEHTLLESLFSYRDQVSTEELENSFYRSLPAIQRSLKSVLVDDGHYLHHPTTVRSFFLFAGFGAGLFVAFAGSAFMVGVLGREPLSAILAGLLTGLIVAGFGMIMPARTRRGTRVLERLRGFEEFLGRVEGDRFDRVVRSPELFERYLPYAMAFGVEKNWARSFDDIYRSPPDWYRGRGTDGFIAHAFANRLSGMTQATGSAMTSAPRSSSSSSGSSGFGGGGSSGGGFGGGGVGGF